MNASTDRSVYLKAAERIETKQDCGCCAAILNSGGIKTTLKESFKRKATFDELFKPDGVGKSTYWMGLCSCHTDANIEFRVLAMCFMAAMVEAGDA